MNKIGSIIGSMVCYVYKTRRPSSLFTNDSDDPILTAIGYMPHDDFDFDLDDLARWFFIKYYQQKGVHHWMIASAFYEIFKKW